MKSIKQNKIKYYSIPILLGIVMLSIVSFWICNEKKVYKKQTISIIKNEAKVIVEAIKGIVQSQMREGRINKKMLNFVLSNIVEKTTLKSIHLYNNKKILFNIGSLPKINSFDYKEKYLLNNNMFYYYQSIDLKKPPIHLHPKFRINKFYNFMRQDNNANVKHDTSYDFRNSKQKIIIGFSISSFNKQISEANTNLLVIYFISIAAIIIFIFAWIYLIKSSQLKLEFEKIKSRTEKLEELGLAAAGLAHEIKNPLGIIRGLAQEISKKAFPNSPVKELSTKIIDETDVTTERLSDFMNYAKHRPPKLQKFNIEYHIKEMAEMLKHEFNDRKIAFNLRLDSIIIEADKEFLSQIIINILLNSIKACKSGNTVNLIAKKNNNEVIIEISDNGPGINKNIFKDVFKPYVSGYPDGHGIGLTIVKKFVEELGWEINMTSSPGNGTKTKISKIKIL